MRLEGYRIFKQEPLSETFLRVMNEQIDLSLNLCQKSSEEPDTITHEIRKITKRIRALYRLFRKAIGEASFQSGQNHNRNLSQLLAPHRLSAVHIETLQMIRMDKRLTTDPAVLDKLIIEFQQNHRQLTIELIEEQKLFQQILILLTIEKENIKSMLLLPCEFQALAEGLRMTYRNGRKYLQIALKEPTAENLHNLRKIVKYLWNQMILLRPLWPPVMGTTIHHLDLLAERLGNEHDLAELSHYLSNEKAIITETQRNDLNTCLDRRRQQIQKTIQTLSIRLFAERPGTFAKRMLAYHEMFVEMK